MSTIAPPTEPRSAARGPQRGDLIQREHRKRQSRCEQESAAPIDVGTLLRRDGKHQPAGDDRDQPEGNVDPKHPAPPKVPISNPPTTGRR